MVEQTPEAQEKVKQAVNIMAERIEAGREIGMHFRFWFSDKYGLIRDSPRISFPEVWKGKWVRGTPYVLDAITGMGEDPWSCGEWADEWSNAQAEDYALRWLVDLYAAGERESLEAEP